MKSLYKIVAITGLTFMATSCHDNAKPNYQFFPNMYESVSYETYSEHDVFKNGKEGQQPALGSIKRGFVPYEIPNTTEGYALAKETLKSPLDSISKSPEKGKELFNIYCAICHGEKGNGKGKLVEREKFLGVPSYKDREITEGSIYHVVTYGLNSMGSHANQLTQEERWQVADYVLKLKSEL
ncbi:c-type cytochrome [Flavobacterium jejuense]|uniref:C-type cytochrome n=1 Tax=Flavobacterium jejuense TaxID=1544455 RepID=A0ABX0IUH9_9FLAO|nr:c-type cytochrome [Flavobacterium jejuense]NHN27467.1 c-type cytochrome [Flavobacterium jejuense]